MQQLLVAKSSKNGGFLRVSEGCPESVLKTFSSHGRACIDIPYESFIFALGFNSFVGRYRDDQIHENHCRSGCCCCSRCLQLGPRPKRKRCKRRFDVHTRTNEVSFVSYEFKSRLFRRLFLFQRIFRGFAKQIFSCAAVCLFPAYVRRAESCRHCGSAS